MGPGHPTHGPKPPRKTTTDRPKRTARAAAGVDPAVFIATAALIDSAALIATAALIDTAAFIHTATGASARDPRGNGTGRGTPGGVTALTG